MVTMNDLPDPTCDPVASLRFRGRISTKSGRACTILSDGEWYVSAQHESPQFVGISVDRTPRRSVPTPQYLGCRPLPSAPWPAIDFPVHLALMRNSTRLHFACLTR